MRIESGVRLVTVFLLTFINALHGMKLIQIIMSLVHNQVAADHITLPLLHVGQILFERFKIGWVYFAVNAKYVIRQLIGNGILNVKQGCSLSGGAR